MTKSEQRLVIRANNRAKGLCACGRPRIPGARSCESCASNGRRPRRSEKHKGHVVVGRPWLDCCENFTHYPNCKETA